VTGGAMGLLVAAWFTFADWRLNPAGIFRSEAGTHWDVVLDTVVSWFVPVALLVFAITTLSHYLLAARRRST